MSEKIKPSFSLPASGEPAYDRHLQEILNEHEAEKSFVSARKMLLSRISRWKISKGETISGIMLSSMMRLTEEQVALAMKGIAGFSMSRRKGNNSYTLIDREAALKSLKELVGEPKKESR